MKLLGKFNPGWASGDVKGLLLIFRWDGTVEFVFFKRTP